MLKYIFFERAAKHIKVGIVNETTIHLMTKIYAPIGH